VHTSPASKAYSVPVERAGRESEICLVLLFRRASYFDAESVVSTCWSPRELAISRPPADTTQSAGPLAEWDLRLDPQRAAAHALWTCCVDSAFRVHGTLACPRCAAELVPGGASPIPSRGMSKDKRRSIFGSSGLTAFAGLKSTSTKDESQPSNLLRKRRAASFMSTISDISQYGEKQAADTAQPDTPAPGTPRSTVSRGSLKRASSVFGSIRGYKLQDDDEPLSATSTRTSYGFGEYLGEDTRVGQVLHYGEVQTSSSMFRKKKEYLVLTEKHLIRYKSQSKAAEAFPV
jgi:hypothetical protein